MEGAKQQILIYASQTSISGRSYLSALKEAHLSNSRFTAEYYSSLLLIPESWPRKQTNKTQPKPKNIGIFLSVHSALGLPRQSLHQILRGRAWSLYT